MNDLTLNWKRISKGLPRVKNSSNDRAPTLEEIRKLIEYPDRRIKPIVYPMASGGFRLGAWDYLCWKHVSPITNEKGEVIAAIITVDFFSLSTTTLLLPHYLHFQIYLIKVIRQKFTIIGKKILLSIM
jgi:hypothetical protein